MLDPLLDDLIERITKGQVVAVIGAGVSMAATGGAKAAGWGGLLQLGIEHCKEGAIPRPPDGWADCQNDALKGDLNDLLSVAEQVSSHLRLARIAKNDTERRIHVESARKAWESIDRPDLVKELDAEFPVPAKRRRKPALAAD